MTLEQEAEEAVKSDKLLKKYDWKVQPYSPLEFDLLAAAASRELRLRKIAELARCGIFHDEILTLAKGKP